MVHGGRVNSSPLNSQHSLFQHFHDVSITFTISLLLSLASSSASFLPRLSPFISFLLLLFSSSLLLRSLSSCIPRNLPLSSHQR